MLSWTSACFPDHGITRIERVMTDNAWAYQHSLKVVCASLGARRKSIKPHWPFTRRIRGDVGGGVPYRPSATAARSRSISSLLRTSRIKVITNSPPAMLSSTVYQNQASQSP